MEPRDFFKRTLLLFVILSITMYYVRSVFNPSLEVIDKDEVRLTRKEAKKVLGDEVDKNPNRVYSRVTTESYVLVNKLMPFTYEKIPITEKTVTYTWKGL